MSMLNLKSFYYLSTTTCLKARFPFLQMCWFSCSLAFIFVSFIIISIYHYVYYDQSIVLVSFLEYKDLLGFCKYWSCCQHFPILELAFQYFEQQPPLCPRRSIIRDGFSIFTNGFFNLLIFSALLLFVRFFSSI